MSAILWGLKRSTLWIYILLAVVTVATYAQVFTHDFVSYDDPDYITANPHVQTGLTWTGAAWAFSHGYAANWHPLTWLSHMLDWQLFEAQAGMHHMVSVLIHAVSVLLLFGLLRRMTGTVYRGAFVAFAFALHPLHVESVAWASERKDVLSGLFFFLTIWAWLNYVEKPAVWRYLLTAAAFACGLMSKPMLVTLPLVLLLLDAWPLKRFNRRAIIEKLPLAAMAIASSIVTYAVQQRGGAVTALDLVPLHLRIENALLSYILYLVQFIWPSNLSVFYPYPDLTWWKIALAAAALIAITVGARRRPYLMTGWLWFLIMLIPVIGLVQVGVQARADRYTYLPIVGLAIMLAWGAAEFLPTRYAAIAGAAVCVAWTAVTWQQITTWQNTETVFRHAIESTDQNYFAYNALGAALRDQGRLDDAIANFESALRVKPHFADAQDNLGESLAAEGRANDAIPHLLEARRLQPESVEACINLGSALHKAGRSKEAETEFRAALAMQPESAEAHGGLGLALMGQGRAQEALPQLLEAVRIHPNDADAHYNLGNAYGALDRSDEAISQFKEAVRLKPSDPATHYNLGLALVSANRVQEAIPEFSASLKINPDSIPARFNLASAFASTGQLDEAIAQFSEVLVRQPDLAAARTSLERCRMLKKSGH
jgi:tetratricopeptide (TPR) repeat protein